MAKPQTANMKVNEGGWFQEPRSQNSKYDKKKKKSGAPSALAVKVAFTDYFRSLEATFYNVGGFIIFKSPFNPMVCLNTFAARQFAGKCG